MAHHRLRQNWHPFTLLAAVVTSLATGKRHRPAEFDPFEQAEAPTIQVRLQDLKPLFAAVCRRHGMTLQDTESQPCEPPTESPAA